MKRLLFVAVVALLATTLTAQTITVKYWTSTPTGNLAEALAVVTGGTEPDVVEELEAIDFWDNARFGNDYVSSMEGWIIPPTTGEYTFYIAADDHAGLYLSPDRVPENIIDTPICQIDGWSNQYQWKDGIEKSAPIALEGGIKYAFRAVQREGGGGDGSAIAWTGPGIDEITVLTGAAIANTGAPILPINPLNEEDHVTSVNLQWEYAEAPEGTTYTVSFGSDPALMIFNFPATTTELPLGDVGAGLTDFDMTYYWQITASDGAMSDLLSFDTETKAPQFDRLEGTLQPTSINGADGDAVTLEAAAVSYVPSDITYQWFKVVDGNGVAVDGAVDANLALDPASAEDDGSYYCVATNDAGSAESDTAVIDIQVGLVHRWTFNDGDVTEIDGQLIALDVVSGADGIISNGSGTAVVADGQLTTGNPSGTRSDDPNGVYVDLPNGIISALGSATVESWVTYDDDALSIWSRVWTFGTSNGGEGISDAADWGTSSLWATIPNSGGGNVQLEYRNPQVQVSTNGHLPLHQEVLMTVVHDELGGLGKLYLNGIAQTVLVPNRTLGSIEDINNWLGRSQWGGDPMFTGSYNEVRIHDTVLSTEQIMANYLAGPDALGVVATGPCDENIAGDVNGDCVIDMGDAAVLIEQFLIDELFAD